MLGSWYGWDASNMPAATGAPLHTGHMPYVYLCDTRVCLPLGKQYLLANPHLHSSFGRPGMRPVPTCSCVSTDEESC